MVVSRLARLDAFSIAARSVKYRATVWGKAGKDAN
jgi:hypothetical protein